METRSRQASGSTRIIESETPRKYTNGPYNSTGLTGSMAENINGVSRNLLDGMTRKLFPKWMGGNLGNMKTFKELDDNQKAIVMKAAMEYLEENHRK